MEEETTRDSAGWPNIHKCKGCLGPLHFQTCPGSRLSITADGQYAERHKETFQNALAFSNRPIAVGEKIRIRVERCDQHWEGALRVGFTARPPSLFALDSGVLTVNSDDVSPSSRAYWAQPLPISHSWPGAELCFWVDSCGVFKYVGPEMKTWELFNDVAVDGPLWALVDICSQTRAVRLLGSKKKINWFTKRTSCPMPAPPKPSYGDSCMCVDRGQRCRVVRSPSTYTATDDSTTCVVCLVDDASETLACGHRCLCSRCAVRVMGELGTCPLCRHST